MAAATSVDLDGWRAELDGLMDRIGPRFARPEPRSRAGLFVQGLLAGLPRTNGWTIAEHAGELHPRGMQRLLAEAVWDHDGVRDDLRDYAVANLGDKKGGLGPVLVLDETGDVKKGTKTVGVQRQYSGTAGRVENCQVAVYLGYATASGYTLIDHAPYLPKAWTENPDRMRTAGVPDDVEFATKPALAQAMVTRALTGGLRAAWVTADEVYGNTATLRRDLAEKHLGYVLAIAKTHPITTAIGTRTAIDMAHRNGLRWHTYSAGPGVRGPRDYDWAWIEVTDPAHTTDTDTDTDGSVTGQDWLLIRRHPRTGELAFYRAHAPGPVALKTLVAVAGTRWRIEDSFAGTKELAALDHHQVRTWTAWHRWSLLAMIAHAILAVLTTRQDPPTPGLIRLTRHEIRHLLVELTRTLHTALHLTAWSIWRRHHQATAQASHQRQTTSPTQDHADFKP